MKTAPPDPMRCAWRAVTACARAGPPARVLCATLALALIFTGCSSLGTRPTGIVDDSPPGNASVQECNLPQMPSRLLSLEAHVTAALNDLSFDPLAPNWQIRECRLAPNLFYIVLRKKRFTSSGDGEAPNIIRRRASVLALSAGAGSYELVEYAESVESETTGTRRMTTAVVRLTAERVGRIP